MRLLDIFGKPKLQHFDPPTNSFNSQPEEIKIILQKKLITSFLFQSNIFFIDPLIASLENYTFLIAVKVNSTIITFDKFRKKYYVKKYLKQNKIKSLIIKIC